MKLIISKKICIWFVFENFGCVACQEVDTESSEKLPVSGSGQRLTESPRCARGAQKFSPEPVA
eukprot:5672114-Pleurochrysis_carterae.AAC.1